jgi:hypothetical protein
LRSFVASLALLVAGVFGSAALAGYVLSNTVLEPNRPGEVIGAVLGDPEQRKRLVDELGRFGGPEATKQVDAVLDHPRVRERIEGLRLNDGTVDVTALRQRIATELMERGHRAAAAKVRDGRTAIDLPGRYAENFEKLSTMASFAALWGTVAAVALVVLAVLVSPDRRGVLRTTGVMILSTVALVLGLFLLVPFVLQVINNTGMLAVGADVIRASGDGLVGPLVTVAIIGVIFLAAGTFWLKPRRPLVPGAERM